LISDPNLDAVLEGLLEPLTADRLSAADALRLLRASPDEAKCVEGFKAFFVEGFKSAEGLFLLVDKIHFVKKPEILILSTLGPVSPSMAKHCTYTRGDSR